MKVESLSTGQGLDTAWLTLGEGWMLKLTSPTVQINVTDHQGWVTITVDPLGQDRIARLDVDEIHAHEIQVRVKVRGRKI